MPKLTVKETAGVLRVHREDTMNIGEEAVIGTLHNTPGVLRWFRYAGNNTSLTLDELEQLVDELKNQFRD